MNYTAESVEFTNHNILHYIHILMFSGILEGKQLHTLGTISVNVIPVPTPKKVGGRRG